MRGMGWRGGSAASDQMLHFLFNVVVDVYIHSNLAQRWIISNFSLINILLC